MPVKNLDDLAIGDILSGDITNSRGLVLVRSGAEVTDAHIRLFRMWGVNSAPVADSDAPETAGAAAVTEAHLDRAKAKITRCFGDSIDNEVMAEILRVAVEMRAEKLAVGEIHDSE